MGLFKNRPTKAQLGAANVPELHTTTAAPAGLSHDLDGDEYATPPADQPRLIRGFRAPAIAPATPAIALGDKQSTRAAEHASKGKPDPRRTETELSGHASGESSRFQPMPVIHVNVRQAVALSEEAPPDRPRAGWTGEDNTRAAVYQHAHVMRPFDKAIGVDHPGELDKVPQPAPLAARPPDRDALAGGLPFAGGSASSRREGVGVQPNSFRLLPRAWDTNALNIGGPAVSAATPDPAHTAASRARARSFRA